MRRFNQCLHCFLTVLLCLATNAAFSQKKPIDTQSYEVWKHLDNIQQSNSGEIVCYEILPLEGDGALVIGSLKRTHQTIVERGEQAKVHFGDHYVAFLIKPQHDTIRKLTLDEVKKIKFPKDTLAIYFSSNDSIAKYPNITSFKVAERGDWMAYLSSKDLRPVPKEKKKKKKKKSDEFVKTTGHTLFVYNPVSGKRKKLNRVTDYEINETASYLAYVTSEKGDKDSLSLHVLNLADLSITTLIENQISIEKMNFDYAGNQLLFLSSADTGKTKNYSLSYWKSDMHNSRILIDSTTKGMPNGWTVSKNYYAKFSRNGERIFCGTNEILSPEPKDTLLEDEKCKVDVWASQDLRIQPEQLNSVRRDKNKAYKAVYHLESGSFVQLANETMSEVYTFDHDNSEFAMGVDDEPHSRERTWEYPWKSDYYFVSLKNGKTDLIKDSVLFGYTIAPSGRQFIWFNQQDSSWMSTDIISKQENNISSITSLKFAGDNNGMPAAADPEGNSGWAKVDGEEYFVVRDFYDIWFLHPTNSVKTFCLTNGEGRKNQVQFHLMRTEYENTYITIENCILKGMNYDSKDESIYKIISIEGTYSSELLFESKHKITYFSKAKESDRVLMRRMTFVDYPDLESTNLNCENPIKLSNANPQQKDYNWATVEFVEWKAYDETPLRGLLYKPEDFDSTKSYPMIVYFYETYQDNFHYYYSPKPTASIIYPTEYASNVYIVFIPDVRYEPGHPAKSAYNCIVSGTDYLCRNNTWIDSTRLGLQGQSWGGYQTAQLVTMTGKYKAAMAGAPVSNMFSAYGGVRWGSGLSRMFQYERTQSRIGSTIWERPDLYIENSPIFGLPNVTTPLLIMHNDNDGAVPWYQGIELYMGLRRLDKPVWMLNYNGDDHNLTKLPNKRDLSIRMRQFFDYYLLNAPIPTWMIFGVPAVDKGIDPGYELEKN